MMSPLHTWAARWGVSPQAFQELQQALGMLAPPLVAGDPGHGKSEAWAQSAERLAASRQGIAVFRNNVGALKDERGRLVRFGLGNDSKGLNEVLKSSDLIGIKPVVIQPQHVGHTFGQFWAREMKEPGWHYTGTPREAAQMAFIGLVNAHGGDAAFSTGATP